MKTIKHCREIKEDLDKLRPALHSLIGQVVIKMSRLPRWLCMCSTDPGSISASIYKEIGMLVVNLYGCSEDLEEAR
jgi:hypothetical protein